MKKSQNSNHLIKIKKDSIIRIDKEDIIKIKFKEFQNFLEKSRSRNLNKFL